MDTAAASLLFRVISMGTRSLLQYVSESFPWSSDKSHVALDLVKLLAAGERDFVVRLMRILQKKHIRMPSAGSYPSHFTTMNYVTVDYLLPKLIAEIEKEIAEIERLLHPVNDDEARGLAESYLAMKRDSLDTLRPLVASPAAA